MIETKIQIRFADIDMFRHVNNATIQHYYDTGAYHYYSTVLGKSDFFHSDNMIVKVTETTNFYSPIHLNDDIRVLTRISKIGNKSLTLHQEIHDGKGIKKSDCVAIVAGFNIKTEESNEISSAWKTLIAEHEGISL